MRSAKVGVGSARTAQCLAGARKRSVDRAAISKMPHQPLAASRPHAFFRAKRFHKRSEVEITPSELKEVRGPKAAAMGRSCKIAAPRNVGIAKPAKSKSGPRWLKDVQGKKPALFRLCRGPKTGCYFEISPIFGPAVVGAGGNLVAPSIFAKGPASGQTPVPRR